MHKMVWSIFKDSSDHDIHVWEENEVAFYWNYDIEASVQNRLKFLHDGEYEVFYGNQSRVLTVEDGRWDVEKAMDLIGEMVDTDGYWGTFIEGFEKRDGKLEVIIGS